MLVIELLKAIVFGLIEGITEWLPVSSTGHLILLEEFLSFTRQSPAFLSMFNVVIQLGAILAVVVIYMDKLNPFKTGKSQREVRFAWQLWAKVVLAASPAALIGLSFDDWFDKHFHDFVPVALMLVLYGVVFIWIENRSNAPQFTVTELVKLPYRTAFLIGLFQVLSLMPGTSRSGATIIGGLLLGVSRPVVTEFTFFLGIPIMFGASLVKVIKFVLSGNRLTVSQLMILLMAMLTAFVVSMFVIRMLTNFVKRHDFKVFGYYRIALGLVLLIYVAAKMFLFG